MRFLNEGGVSGSGHGVGEEALPAVEPGMRIPRIIHQTYGRRELPAALQSNVDALKARNPGWDYRFYDDAAIETFIREHYSAAVLALYLRIDPAYGAARADVFRYLLMYRLGGVYLDIKSRFLRPIDEVLDGDEGFVISQWSNGKGERYEGSGLKAELAHIEGGEFQQWHIIAAPGHPFLRAVLLELFARIESYRPWRDGVGKLGVIRLTGPIMYTLAIAPLLGRYPCKIVRHEAAMALEYSIVADDTHKALFARHYSVNTRAVVMPLGPQRLVYGAYAALRACKALLTRR